MSGGFGPGEVYNRRVTKHIRELLPDRPASSDNYTFGGTTTLDADRHPGGRAGGRSHLRAYVGEDGQITVLEQSRITSDEETLWACQNRIRRTHEIDGTSMEPFTYDVQTRLRSRGETKGNRRPVSIAEFTEKPVYGGREAQAALLLAEKIAVRKETSVGSAEGLCCSLHGLPSLSRVIDQSIVGLDWRTVNDLLGPEADTIAANADVELLRGERRKEAESKGLTIFTDDPDEQAERALEHRGRDDPAPDGRDDPAPDARDDDPTQLPEGMSPEKAREELRRIADEIREMKSGSSKTRD